MFQPLTSVLRIAPQWRSSKSGSQQGPDSWTRWPDAGPMETREKTSCNRSDTVKKYVPKVWNMSLLFGRQCHAPLTILTHWDLDILYCTCSKNVAHADRKDYQTYAMKSIESTKLIWNGIKGWQSWQHKGFNHITFDSFDKPLIPQTLQEDRSSTWASFDADSTALRMVLWLTRAVDARPTEVTLTPTRRDWKTVGRQRTFDCCQR